jgi:hypothetical protein
VQAVLDAIAEVMPANKVILFSAETGEGVDEWLDWLASRRALSIADAAGVHPHTQTHTYTHPGAHEHPHHPAAHGHAHGPAHHHHDRV